MKQRNNILIENALISDADMIARIENECFSAPESAATEFWCTEGTPQDTVTFQKEERLDSIVVSSNRANMNTPVTYTQITKKQLQRE